MKNEKRNWSCNHHWIARDLSWNMWKNMENLLNFVRRIWLQWMDSISFIMQLTQMLWVKTDNWEEEKQGCFRVNKVNHVKFGTYYLIQLKNLYQIGTRDKLDWNGMSAYRNNLNIWNSKDCIGESTFMNDATIAGGIKNYTNKDSINEKWMLPRVGQTKHWSELLTLAGWAEMHANIVNAQLNCPAFAECICWSISWWNWKNKTVQLSARFGNTKFRR